MAILSKSKTFIGSQEEEKKSKPGMTEVKFIDTMANGHQQSSQSMVVQNRQASQSMVKRDGTSSLASNPFNVNLTQSMSGGTRRHGGSMVEKDSVHEGRQDSKFAQMFNEGMKNFRIRQFAKDRANPNFGLMDPSLLNGKNVVYKVMGED